MRRLKHDSADTPLRKETGYVPSAVPVMQAGSQPDMQVIEAKPTAILLRKKIGKSRSKPGQIVQGNGRAGTVRRKPGAKPPYKCPLSELPISIGRLFLQSASLARLYFPK